jgi:hypothetical protein
MQSPPDWRAFLFPARGFREPLNKSHEGATLAFRDSATAGGASAVRPGGGAALAPLRTFRGATVRERTREARRSEWLTPFASRATKQIARKGAPDSDSRSVEREGAQAAARNIVKRGAHAAAPALKEPLIKSRAMRVAGERRPDARREGAALSSHNASPSNAADGRLVAATRMGRGNPCTELRCSSLVWPLPNGAPHASP